MEDARLLVHLFVSRNKDNEGVPDFQQRRQSFVAYEDSPSLPHRFEDFVCSGVPGEMSRLYRSVNARDPEAIRKRLLSKLIFDPVQLPCIDGVIAGLAAKGVCAAEHRWLFDFDSTDPTRLSAFIVDVCADMGLGAREVERHRTPNGYGIIVPHGFDTRKLLDDWRGTVELKRDDLLCIGWATRKDGR